MPVPDEGNRRPDTEFTLDERLAILAVLLADVVKLQLVTNQKLDELARKVDSGSATTSGAQTTPRNGAPAGGGTFAFRARPPGTDPTGF